MKNWQPEYKCINPACYRVLSITQVMDSHGMCPYCGHKYKSACTIVETEYRAFRYTAPWWKFWDYTKEYKK